MRQDPSEWIMTPEQYEWLARIFRFIPKEINTSEDKEKLAPGELGINYKRGEIWVRNPHTGKIFCPNSVEFWKSISAKYNPKTKILNADTVRGITFYTDLIELEHLDTSYTPDTVIRQMYAPAILYAPVQYDNFEAINWPSASGMVYVVKITEEYVIIRYYADGSNLEYEGRYNQAKHLFEGWVLSSGNPDDYFSDSEGGGDHTNINLNISQLYDLMTVIVHVTEELSPGADLSVNNGPAKPILWQTGQPLDTEVAANTTIMLIYDELRDAWIMLNSTDSVTAAILRIVLERVADALKKVDDSKSDMETKVDEKLEEIDTRVDTKLKELSEKYDRLLENMSNTIITRPGNLVPVISYFEAGHDNIDAVETIDDFDGSVDVLLVNYGQTILRAGMDYSVVNNGIALTDKIKLMKGDILQFIVMKQAKS
ncbi:MAG: hypothetical protein NC489_08985 [Ruminococcus flavefaciens]|nr:hypothetical protein [Ruminococcus flavefaciens]